MEDSVSSKEELCSLERRLKRVVKAAGFSYEQQSIPAQPGVMAFRVNARRGQGKTKLFISYDVRYDVLGRDASITRADTTNVSVHDAGELEVLVAPVKVLTCGMRVLGEEYHPRYL